MIRSLACSVVIAALACTLATVAPAEEGGGARRRPMARAEDRSQDLSRQESQIRRTRAVTRRIVRDRRASEAVKQKASELDALLDKRQQLIDRLQERQKTFTQQHQAEIDELEGLRRRAREIDDRLESARKDVLEASKDDLATLKQTSAHAADLADALRTYYLQERRGRLGAPGARNPGAK